MTRTSFVLLPLAALLPACFTTVTIDHKTALERQVIGTYESLGPEVMMLASVRAEPPPAEGEAAAAPDAEATPPAEAAVDAETDPAAERLRSAQGQEMFRRALAARRMELFLRDDVDELKQAGCLLEKPDGTLGVLPCGAAQESEDTAARVERVVQHVNDARGTLVDFILFANTDLGPEDRAEIIATLHALKQRS